MQVGEPRSATVTAAEDTQCILISKTAFLPVLIARADVSVHTHLSEYGTT
jgi:CRP-like cAMP-binding protein